MDDADREAAGNRLGGDKRVLPRDLSWHSIPVMTKYLMSVKRSHNGFDTVMKDKVSHGNRGKVLFDRVLSTKHQSNAELTMLQHDIFN